MFNYTGKFASLVGIIINGFEYNRCEEDLPLIGFTGSPFSIPSVVRHFKLEIARL
ncbi:MAG: hypothetical protein GY936_02315 [Ignavibacteriae bacterium]|nr:hypothetical protein [Ignavibacteriota bacterium]